MFSAEKNAVKILKSRFASLLDKIEGHHKGSETSKDYTINSIKSFVNERISEKDLDENSEIWKIILHIKELDFDNLDKVKRIYFRLFDLKPHKQKKKVPKEVKQSGKKRLSGWSCLFDSN